MNEAVLEKVKSDNCRKLLARLFSGLVGAFWLFMLVVSIVERDSAWNLEGFLMTVFMFLSPGVAFYPWIRGRLGGRIALFYGSAFGVFAYFSAGHNHGLAVLVSGVPFLLLGAFFLWAEG